MTTGINLFKGRVSRRAFLKAAGIAWIAGNFPKPSFATLGKDIPNAKVLHLFHPESEESLTTTYWSGGKYVDSALSDIDFIMRDRHTGETRQIDKDLLDLLYNISLELTTNKPFHILSGYRCPETNELLRKQGWAVSVQSLHEKGKAVDIRLPSTHLSSLRRAAYRLKKGGVGYYPKLDFVHIDIGTIRYWRK